MVRTNTSPTTTTPGTPHRSPTGAAYPPSSPSSSVRSRGRTPIHRSAHRRLGRRVQQPFDPGASSHWLADLRGIGGNRRDPSPADVVPVDEGSAIAVAYDVLPLVLFVAPVIAVSAVITGHLLLAGAAGALIVYHTVLVVPRMVSDRIPAWAKAAPRFRLLVANVYVDNPTPQAAAAQLVGSDADVIVIAEATPEFMSCFDAAGGNDSHPLRVIDPTDTSDYAVAIASRLPLRDSSGVRTIGALRLSCRGRHRRAHDNDRCVESDGHLRPGRPRDLEATDRSTENVHPHRVRTTRGRGGSQHHPLPQELLETGLMDGIDSLGQAWSSSFSLKSVWPLGSIDSLPALTTRPWCSDHLPFLSPWPFDHSRLEHGTPTKPPPSTAADQGSGQLLDAQPACRARNFFCQFRNPC